MLMRSILLFLTLFFFSHAGFASAHQDLKCFHVSKQERAYPIGYLSPGKKLHLVIELPIRNKAKRDRLIQSIYDSNSPEYHRYLTPREFADRFAPTKADYEKVANFFKRKGFRVTKSPGRTILNIEGPVRLIEASLHTRIRLYSHPNKHGDFYAPDKTPWIDLDIPLSGIIGLDNFRKPHPL